VRILETKAIFPCGAAFMSGIFRFTETPATASETAIASVDGTATPAIHIPFLVKDHYQLRANVLKEPSQLLPPKVTKSINDRLYRQLCRCWRFVPCCLGATSHIPDLLSSAITLSWTTPCSSFQAMVRRKYIYIHMMLTLLWPADPS
jgi:hypothetical protein